MKNKNKLFDLKSSVIYEALILNTIMSIAYSKTHISTPWLNAMTNRAHVLRQHWCEPFTSVHPISSHVQ